MRRVNSGASPSIVCFIIHAGLATTLSNSFDLGEFRGAVGVTSGAGGQVLIMKLNSSPRHNFNRPTEALLRKTLFQRVKLFERARRSKERKENANDFCDLLIRTSSGRVSNGHLFWMADLQSRIVLSH